mmetsp:Transcript_22642/g.49465  ORF Transcript_22642/g.49465 Transcript_22642/m.49465 type:complete len:314 (-) Transcript_22642:169-1110(-)
MRFFKVGGIPNQCQRDSTRAPIHLQLHKPQTTFPRIFVIRWRTHPGRGLFQELNGLVNVGMMHLTIRNGQHRMGTPLVQSKGATVALRPAARFGCHDELGLGAPPRERRGYHDLIKTVADPTSVVVVIVVTIRICPSDNMRPLFQTLFHHVAAFATDGRAGKVLLRGPDLVDRADLRVDDATAALTKMFATNLLLGQALPVDGVVAIGSVVGQKRARGVIGRISAPLVELQHFGAGFALLLVIIVIFLFVVVAASRPLLTVAAAQRDKEGMLPLIVLWMIRYSANTLDRWRKGVCQNSSGRAVRRRQPKDSEQ